MMGHDRVWYMGRGGMAGLMPAVAHQPRREFRLFPTASPHLAPLWAVALSTVNL